MLRLTILNKSCEESFEVFHLLQDEISFKFSSKKPFSAVSLRTNLILHMQFQGGFHEVELD